MATNIVLGIGGTGAKVVESFLMLLVAGVNNNFNDKYYIGIVDQDSANGNVERTKQFLQTAIDFKRKWQNHIKWPADGACYLGATNINAFFDDDKSVWEPNPERNLKSIIGEIENRTNQQVFDLLFTDDNHEQKMDLSEGYRGRAHVGSTAFLNSLTANENDIIRQIKSYLNQADKSEVNIFLIGSAFGGTGASGFPNLARKINALSYHEVNGVPKKQANINIGGLLMLPYFEFKDPDAENEEDLNVVTTSELLPKAQVALEFYDSLMKNEKPFNKLYVMGWNPFVKLGYHEAGSKTQENPALLPELFGASAMVDFFSKEKSEDAPDGEGNDILCSMRQGQNIVWADFCDQKIYERLTNFLRFSAYWRFNVRNLLMEKDKFFGGAPNWAKRISKITDKNVSYSAEELRVLDKLVVLFMHWAATIEVMGKDANVTNGLWDFGQLVDHIYQAPQCFRTPVIIKNYVDEEIWKNSIDRLTRHVNGEPVACSYSLFNHFSNIKDIFGEQSELGKLVCEIYRATDFQNLVNK